MKTQSIKHHKLNPRDDGFWYVNTIGPDPEPYDEKKRKEMNLFIKY